VTVPLDDYNLPAQLGLGINDQMDMRDRFVWIEGRWSTATDIRVAAASPANDAIDGTPFAAMLYSGPGTIQRSPPSSSTGLYTFVLTTNVYLQFEFSRGNVGQGFHSRLVVVNLSGSDLFLNAAVETSGHLGLTDRRAPGPPV
jgi:hypothetical protein